VIIIEEGGLDVHVVDAPPLMCSKCDKDADGLNTSHGCERVVIVDPLLLEKGACDEPCLVLDYLPCLVINEL
jgi:hypothetical protein